MQPYDRLFTLLSGSASLAGAGGVLIICGYNLDRARWTHQKRKAFVAAALRNRNHSSAALGGIYRFVETCYSDRPDSDAILCMPSCHPSSRNPVKCSAEGKAMNKI